jgi:hypothetical protein
MGRDSPFHFGVMSLIGCHQRLRVIPSSCSGETFVQIQKAATLVPIWGEGRSGDGEDVL